MRLEAIVAGRGRLRFWYRQLRAEATNRTARGSADAQPQAPPQAPRALPRRRLRAAFRNPARAAGRHPPLGAGDRRPTNGSTRSPARSSPNTRPPPTRRFSSRRSARPAFIATRPSSSSGRQNAWSRPMAAVPQDEWIFLGHALILHGRRVCAARKPACSRCGLASICPKTGSKRRASRGFSPRVAPAPRAAPLPRAPPT